MAAGTNVTPEQVLFDHLKLKAFFYAAKQVTFQIILGYMVLHRAGVLRRRFRKWLANTSLEHIELFGQWRGSS
jgi:hypothetical protein